MTSPAHAEHAERAAGAGAAAQPRAEQVRVFWAAFQTARPDLADEAQPADVFAFGDSADMADRLLDLVLTETKRATAGALAEYDAEGWRPQVGDLSVVHNGDGAPIAVVRSTDITVGPLTSVTDSFAWDEGEGARTREDWIVNHQAYFARTFAQQGLPYHDDLEVVFERFDLVWVTPDAASYPTAP